MTFKSLLETIADWCDANHKDINKILIGEWLDVSTHPIPEYTWCIVDSDEGVLVAYHCTDNEWEDGRIAQVYHWMPLVMSPSYPHKRY